MSDQKPAPRRQARTYEERIQELRDRQRNQLTRKIEALKARHRVEDDRLVAAEKRVADLFDKRRALEHSIAALEDELAALQPEYVAAPVVPPADETN